MAADEWRYCVDWLVRCQILPEDHKVTTSEANAFDLAQILRDGSLICHLLNQLCPSSVDVKDFNLRPQMSQFLCMRNINTFLTTCKEKFGLRDAELFNPEDLFNVTNFRKVLDTLSVLSKTDLAQQRLSGFPPESHHYVNDPDNIYGELPVMADENDLEDDEGLYGSSIYDETDDDDIYEDLVGLRKEIARRSQPVQLTKRDYCLKEMVETEKKYVEALQMIDINFIKPLHTYVFSKQRDVIFAHIQELLSVHKGFCKELESAVESGPNTNTNISSVFIRHKKKLLIYGEFCSNLPAAQDMVDEVSKDETTHAKIIECERKASKHNFKLRDVLVVPAQRVLKYHLLLSELIKNTDSSDPGRIDLEAALEAMQDLSLYVNEVKRDRETLRLIEEIQDSMVGLNMPDNTTLSDYGRFHKDGELRILDSSSRNKTAEKRHVFLFDKVMLICRTKGTKYSFEDAIIVAEFSVEETPKANEKKAGKLSFLLTQRSRTLTFSAKTEDVRLKWIAAMQMAIENSQPSTKHDYVMQTFNEPRECDVCGKLLRGAFFQGYYSQTTKKSVHKECIEKVSDPKPKVLSRNRLSSSAQKARASHTYLGDPPLGGQKLLKFKRGEIIDVLEQKNDDWYKGQLREDEGYFPANCVTIIPSSSSPSKYARKFSYETVGIEGPTSRLSLSGSKDIRSSDVKDYPWYVGDMSREEASSKLSLYTSGTFLIRASVTRKGEYSLSIKYANAVRHIKVNQNSKMMYYVAEGRFFDSIPRLVAYYEENSLKDNFPDVNTKLKTPIKTAKKDPGHGFATALFDYAATSTSQVSLKQHDRIEIYSKAGSDKGWWKGQNIRSEKVGFFPFAYVSCDE